MDIPRQIVLPPFLLPRETTRFFRRTREPSSYPVSLLRRLLASPRPGRPLEEGYWPRPPRASLGRPYEISRNPDAQFSASISSGIQSTYVSSDPTAPLLLPLKWNMRATRGYVRLVLRIYVRARVCVFGSDRASERKGRMSVGRIVNSMGLVPPPPLGKASPISLRSPANTFLPTKSLGGSVRFNYCHQLRQSVSLSFVLSSARELPPPSPFAVSTTLKHVRSIR